jgi:hypothetical protein
MVQYMQVINLGHLAPFIVENGIDGAFLLKCSLDDLIKAGITALQAKKITSYLPK